MRDCLENERGNSIFHFTKRDIAIELILPFQRLKYNFFAQSNDPKENKSFGFGSINSHSNSIDEIINENKKVSNHIKEGARIICFSQDFLMDDEWWDGYNLPRMWAMYGGNHKGVCLEIDKEIFLEENKLTFEKYPHFHENMTYTSKLSHSFLNYNRMRQLGFDDYIEEYRTVNIQKLFFRKQKDWQSEHEYRLLLFSRIADPIYLSIAKSLKKVHVGFDFPLESLKVLKKVTEAKISKIDYQSGRLMSFDFKADYLNSL